jgi:hypothetical protein
VAVVVVFVLVVCVLVVFVLLVRVVIVVVRVVRVDDVRQMVVSWPFSSAHNAWHSDGYLGAKKGGGEGGGEGGEQTAHSGCGRERGI